jgi:hypothetical protein
VHKRLALQGVEEGSNYLHLTPVSRTRRLKRNPVPGVITGHPVPGGYKYRDLGSRLVVSHVEVGSNTSTVALRVIEGDKKGSLELETVKYGHKSHRTGIRE